MAPHCATRKARRKKARRSRCTKIIRSTRTMDLILLIASFISTTLLLRAVPCGLSRAAIRKDRGNILRGKVQHQHLPTDKFHPDFIDSIPIPAKAGDVIFFSYCIIHWSEVNRTDEWRKAVRFGYHKPEMRPVGRDPEEPYNNIMAGGFKTNPTSDEIMA